MKDFKTIIWVLPEYNGNFSSFIKNIIDELSIYNRDFVKDKNIYIVSVTPGARGGESVREIACNMFSHFKANVITNYAVPSYENINQSLGVIQEIASSILKNGCNE